VATGTQRTQRVAHKLIGERAARRPATPAADPPRSGGVRRAYPHSCVPLCLCGCLLRDLRVTFVVFVVPAA